MIIDEQLYQKIRQLTPPFKMEVLRFVDSILLKQEKKVLPPKTPLFGCAKGQFRMTADFDAPLILHLVLNS
jgi:hypothetical protein